MYAFLHEMKLNPSKRLSRISFFLMLLGIFFCVTQMIYLVAPQNKIGTSTREWDNGHGGSSSNSNAACSTVTQNSGSSVSMEKGDDYAVASRQSFGFFHDVTEEQWRVHQTIWQQYSKHMYPQQPLRQLPTGVTAWYQENYDPNFSCAFERRIGGTGNGDGPKWVCDIHRIPLLAESRRRLQQQQQKGTSRNRPGCVVYSVGSNGDFSFELGIQNAVGVDTCEIHVFDPGNFEPKMPKELHAIYHRWGIAGETKNMTSSSVYKTVENYGNVFLSFQDTVKALGHEDLEMIDIFKIDCEGCEWDVYEHWLNASSSSSASVPLPSIQQILVEVHHAPMNKVLSFFDRHMEEGYVIFHKEPNIQYDPTCIEYAFLKLHKDFFTVKN